MLLQKREEQDRADHQQRRGGCRNVARRLLDQNPSRKPNQAKAPRRRITRCRRTSRPAEGTAQRGGGKRPLKRARPGRATRAQRRGLRKQANQRKERNGRQGTGPPRAKEAPLAVASGSARPVRVPRDPEAIRRNGPGRSAIPTRRIGPDTGTTVRAVPTAPRMPEVQSTSGGVAAGGVAAPRAGTAAGRRRRSWKRFLWKTTSAYGALDGQHPAATAAAISVKRRRGAATRNNATRTTLLPRLRTRAQEEEGGTTTTTDLMGGGRKARERKGTSQRAQARKAKAGEEEQRGPARRIGTGGSGTLGGMGQRRTAKRTCLQSTAKPGSWRLLRPPSGLDWPGSGLGTEPCKSWSPGNSPLAQVKKASSPPTCSRKVRPGCERMATAPPISTSVRPYEDTWLFTGVAPWAWRKERPYGSAEGGEAHRPGNNRFLTQWLGERSVRCSKYRNLVAPPSARSHCTEPGRRRRLQGRGPSPGNGPVGATVQNGRRRPRSLGSAAMRVQKPEPSPLPGVYAVEPCTRPAPRRSRPGRPGGHRRGPLFHNGCGRRLTVAEVLSAVEDTALEAGEPLRGEMGQRTFGTHSMRVRGACMAYAAGLPETTIMALGRWTSLDGMRRYLRGAPIRRASQATQEIARAMCEGGEAGHGRAPLDPTRMSGVPLVACGPAVEQSQGGPAGHIQVLLGTTGVLHRPLGFEGPPEQWSTFCGIRWANKRVAGDFSYKKEEKCRRCFSAAAAPWGEVGGVARQQ